MLDMEDDVASDISSESDDYEAVAPGSSESYSSGISESLLSSSKYSRLSSRNSSTFDVVLAAFWFVSLGI